MDEYLRLPRGMHDRNASWNEHKNKIIEFHNSCGKSIGCDVTSYSHVSFKSTFTKDCNITNDKIYEFPDKSGRTLVLTCDSTASILREFLNDPLYLPRRISFITPIFRYWTDNAHNRFFTQLGYCILNEKPDSGITDMHILQLASAMYEFLSQLNIKTTIFLNDYTAIKKIFAKYINENDLKNFIYKFQFSSQEKRLKIIEDVITDIDLCEQMKAIFSSNPVLLSPHIKPEENPLNIPAEYRGIYEMASLMRSICNTDIYFCPTDLHCIEMMDSYTVRFMVDNNFAIAEGGNYSEYAKKFDSHITSFWSICSGIEPLERTAPWSPNLDANKRVAIFNLGVTPSFIIAVMNVLKNQGYCPCYIGDTNSVRSALKQARKKYMHVCIIGEEEEGCRHVGIKNLMTGEINEVLI